MNAMSCDEVSGLIDLYAAHECAPAEARAVRAHLDGCAACREELARSREMLGLLDVHFGEQKALNRLGERLRQETRPSRRLIPLPWLPRLAAVAALLLVTFGLGLWLAPPVGISLRSSDLKLALLTPRDVPAFPAHGRAKVQPNPVPIEVLRPGWDTQIARAKKTGDWPPPPRVDRDLVLRNTGKTPIQVEIGGRHFDCVLEVTGMGVIRRVVDNPMRLPFPARSETIEPGASLALRIERLTSQVGGRVVNLYPAKVGEFQVRVRLRTVGQRDGVREVIRLESGPVKLQVP